MIRIAAPAKINVGLRILGRRDDGFHDLETLFLAVGLFDELRFHPREGGAFELAVAGADVGPDDDNLVLRAARLFRKATGSPIGGRFELEKRIPAGAGLGGGSSDAGAALRVLDAVAGTGLGPDRLADLGGRLGADVAFFSAGAAFARGTGRGERLESLTPPPPRTLLIGVPPVHVATGPAYAALARRRAAGEAVPGPLLPDLVPHDWAGLETLLVNDFEPGVRADHPAVARLLDAMRATVEGPVLLSGSGGACFALPPGDGVAEAAALREAAPRCVVHAVRTLESLPAPETVPDEG